MLVYSISKNVVKSFTEITKRILSYNKTVNDGIEIVQLGDGEIPVFEQFFEANEKYPLVTIASVGGNYVNDFLSNNLSDSLTPLEVMGASSSSVETLSVGQYLQFPVSPSLIGQAISAVALDICHNYLSSLLSDVYIAVIDTATNTILTTGILPLLDEVNLTTKICPLDTEVTVTATTVIKVYIDGVSASYSVAINSSTGSYTYFDGTTLYTRSGSLKGVSYSKSYQNKGGMFRGTIILRCMAKNSTSIVYDVCEMLAIYFHILKYGKLSRTGADGVTIDSTLVSDWSNKGIYVEGISEGAFEQRRRGENDIIYIKPLTIVYNTVWTASIESPLLTGIDATENAF